MPRRSKRLVDLVRDETFLARKDEHLLRGPEKLPWLELEKVRQQALQLGVGGASSPLREFALDFERSLRAYGSRHYLGDLQAQLLKLGPPDSFRQLERFAAWGHRHQKGAKAGQRFQFANFWRLFLEEFWRRDKHGRRIYNVGLFGAPKGSGKSPVTAVLGNHALVSETDSPEVYAVSGSRDQTGHVVDFARMNIERGPLAAWLDAGRTIRCDEHFGEFEILSSEGDLAAGGNLAAGIADEWWLFLHRSQREAINSLIEALVKRAGRSYFLGISTAGYTKASQLGEYYDGAMAHPKVEEHRGGYLRILRDPESGFLMHWYGVPDGLDVDIENRAVIRACNPAPWIKPADLLRTLYLPGANENDWRRLHLNQWTKTKDAWLPSGAWARLRSEAWVPEGRDIWIAIDGSWNYDTTAVVWAARLDDGRIALRCKVFSVREDVPHHVYIPGGTIDTEVVEAFVFGELGERYRIREVVGDPKFLNEMLRRISKRGVMAAEFPQNSKEMKAAYQHLYEAAKGETITWYDETNVFARQVDAAAAVMTENGWNVYKLRSEEPIDCVPGAAMARQRAARDGAAVEPWVIRR